MKAKNITISQGDVSNIDNVLKLGIQLPHVLRLIEISRKLHAIAERECNGSATNRDDNAIPRLLDEARRIWGSTEGKTTMLERVCDPRFGRGLTWGRFGTSFYI
jgi:hypothetical protein